jgi:NADH:ubiquinone oxidoreductase subunit E
MSNQINIKICVGTYSYIMGGAQLMSLEDELPEQWKDKVRIEAVISLPNCNEKQKKPPYVQINDELMEEASIEKIIEKLKSLLTCFFEVFFRQISIECCILVKVVLRN